jgi:phosphoadenosine phosphosulfate reductase
MKTSATDAPILALILRQLPLESRLLHVAALGGRKVFTTSLGIEDQVLTAAIARSGSDIDIVTLETGRLFAQTLALIEETESRFGIEITRFLPDESELDGYVARFGRDGFYDSVEARHACCDVRKLRPLARALDGAGVWVTGVRRGQSAARAETPLVEWDEARGLLKVNPLADRTLDQIKAYAFANDVPLNPLHEKGYPSIGCEPCTRAIKPGESERAGRWWWEQDQTRECGLHVKSSSSPVPPPEPRVHQPT